jgi:putative ABC transport system ATP-binding protein
MMKEKILEVQALKKYFGEKDSETKALDGLSCQIVAGEFIGIMGSSGSGKTTLLNCIATTIHPTSGKILLKGEDITRYKGKQLSAYRGSKLGYLWQNFELLDNLTGKENIMLPLTIHQGGARAEKRIEQVAKYFEIEEVLSKFPAQMSGGQRQRVAIARAIILNPELILADEPTGALDSKNAKSVMRILHRLNKDANSTILMVTHDSIAASYCSRILFIRDGLIFHELRKKGEEESRSDFYERIIMTMAQLEGGSGHVL